MCLCRLTVSKTALWLKQCILGYMKMLCETQGKDSENCSNNQLANGSYHELIIIHESMYHHTSRGDDTGFRMSHCS